jgi:hypothetical protein
VLSLSKHEQLQPFVLSLSKHEQLQPFVLSLFVLSLSKHERPHEAFPLRPTRLREAQGERANRSC